jgi:hypothetical protein
MEPERSTAGDYGYDMAHQDMAGPEPRDGTAPGPRTEREQVTPSPVLGKPDLAEDFGYDQAHDF